MHWNLLFQVSKVRKILRVKILDPPVSTLDSAAERNFTKGKGIEHTVVHKAEMW